MHEMLPTSPSVNQRATYVSNIIDTYRRATPDQVERGRNWYQVAHELAKFIADGDVRKGAGVIAALSPNKAWKINQKMAARAFESGEPSGHMGSALRKAEAIMNGADPETVLPMKLKTGNFYRNILDPSDAEPVTVDRHALNVAAGRPRVGAGHEDPYGDQGLDKANRYASIAQAYRDAAEYLNANGETCPDPAFDHDGHCPCWYDCGYCCACGAHPVDDEVRPQNDAMPPSALQAICWIVQTESENK